MEFPCSPQQLEALLEDTRWGPLSRRIVLSIDAWLHEADASRWWRHPPAATSRTGRLLAGAIEEGDPPAGIVVDFLLAGLLRLSADASQVSTSASSGLHVWARDVFSLPPAGSGPESRSFPVATLSVLDHAIPRATPRSAEQLLPPPDPEHPLPQSVRFGRLLWQAILAVLRSQPTALPSAPTEATAPALANSVVQILRWLRDVLDGCPAPEQAGLRARAMEAIVPALSMSNEDMPMRHGAQQVERLLDTSWGDGPSVLTAVEAAKRWAKIVEEASGAAEGEPT